MSLVSLDFDHSRVRHRVFACVLFDSFQIDAKHKMQNQVLILFDHFLKALSSLILTSRAFKPDELLCMKISPDLQFVSAACDEACCATLVDQATIQ